MRWLLGVAVGCAGWLWAHPATAQRPFQVYDPFYQTETARRSFYDGYMLALEAAYRTAPGLVTGNQPVADGAGLGLSARIEVQLTPQLDAGVILDATGGGQSRGLAWSWATLTYSWTEDFNDYAFRVAVDPNADARLGFPQADVALMASTLLSPRVSSDVAVGARRVRRGFAEYASGDPLEDNDFTLVYQRALGWELHVMLNYNVLLSLSGSRAYASLGFMHGQYRMLEVDRDPAPLVPVPLGEEEFSGGMVAARLGSEWARPAYRVAPFLRWPIFSWQSGERPRPPFTFGASFTLR